MTKTKAVKSETIKPPFKTMDIYPERAGYEYKVANRFTGQEVVLTALATSVYDVIMGAEMMATSLHKDGEQMSKREEWCWKQVRLGLDWFREHYAKEYMILLD